MKKIPRPATRPRQTPMGQWLYEQRLCAGMRQSDLAYRLDIHPGRISEWEQGQKAIPESYLREIQSLLGPCPYN